MLDPSKSPFYIVTRCGVRLGNEAVSVDFLASRAELFNRYFVPSVNQQSDADFKVAVCFDEMVHDRIVEQFVHGLKVSFVVIRTGQPWILAVREYFSQFSDLVTATCDSDDAVASDFVRVSKQILRADCGLCFRQVVRYSPKTGCFEMKPKPSNPFVVRHSSSGKWALDEDGVHGTLGEVAEIDDVWWPPMGLQVVHGSNISNQMFRIVPPFSPTLAGKLFRLDFPQLRTVGDYRRDYVRYLIRPRLLKKFLRKKGPVQVLRTFFQF